MELSTEQIITLDAFRNGENIFLTGPGGSGKTALISYMLDIAEQLEKNIQVCALTGCAAVLLKCRGAKTIHSWSGIGLANGDTFEIVDKVARHKQRKKNWATVDILIIDEISMMSIKLFEILDRIGRRIRKKPNVPFGGIQLVFSGDFYQLPPVGNNHSPDTTAFCFESPFWDTTFHRSIQLTKIFRQKDLLYTKILNQVRIGKMTKSSCNHLYGRIKKYSHPETSTIEGKCEVTDFKSCKPPILLPTRRQVDSINNRELKKLPGETKQFNHSFHTDLYDKSKTELLETRPSPEQLQRELSNLSNGIMVDKILELKVGAQVMCVANIDMESEYPVVNGSLGIITKFIDDAPMVEFHNGQTRLMTKHTWESDNIPGVGVKQIPLILAWAITIHKAQGVTLDLAEIDVGSSIFECGQTYVALSRVKSLEGLYLTSFQPTQIKINRKVRDFYRKLHDENASDSIAAAKLPEKSYKSASALKKQIEIEKSNNNITGYFAKKV